MLGVGFTPFTILLELDFALHELLILARPIIGAAALGARDFYQLILGHTRLVQFWIITVDLKVTYVGKTLKVVCETFSRLAHARDNPKLYYRA